MAFESLRKKLFLRKVDKSLRPVVKHVQNRGSLEDLTSPIFNRAGMPKEDFPPKDKKKFLKPFKKAFGEKEIEDLMKGL